MGTLRDMLLMTYPIKAYTLDNSTIVYKEYQSYAAALDVLRDTAEEILAECVSSTAENRGLEFYEKLFGPVRDDLSLQCKLNSDYKNTLSQIHTILDRH